ncbi:DUF6602 domain-containing protein [Larsenimonas rhizosphaerae]|uniref:DUF6602 domain-containing protein n=1 Tax=Larsenimonas rhizosphaerae TaxID=2944682 RepID=UPI002033ECA5|nr:DUF6602 domain-containing protein [Larsenimonas rhizosphaerae]MCM2130038.1 hypothetical protein [Larsenimonas rhizosphaerae]
MIRKASELLEYFIEAEEKKISGVEMPHMPTLGSAYEEITKQGIDQHFAIPKHLDLKVVSGFIELSGKMLPEQIDCMLVCGEGKRFGITEQYIYDIENVLCVFEAKKTLSKKDFSDAVSHLGKIKKAFSEYFEHKLINEAYDPDVDVIGLRFSQLTGKAAPTHYMGIHELPESEGMLFYALVQEFFAPVTIIHGYSGYTTERGIRKAFLDIIEEKKAEDGIGVGIPTIPSLVTSGNYSLIKGNGLPFLGVCQDNKWAPVLSTRYNSAKLILELIWMKISVRLNIKMPYDDGLYMENLEPLLVAEAMREGDVAGWMYNSIEPSEKFLKRNDDRLWSPVTIGKPEVSAINLMAFKGGYLQLDKDLDEYLKGKYEISVEELKDTLISTRLFMLFDGYIRPIHSQIHMITCDDGSGFVSSERERFDVWCEENQIKPHYLNLIFME